MVNSFDENFKESFTVPQTYKSDKAEPWVLADLFLLVIKYNEKSDHTGTVY